MYFNRVASDSELAAPKTHVITVVLQINESTKDAAHVVIHIGVKFKKLTPILVWIAHSIDARHRSHNDGVTTSQQRRSR